MSAAVSCRKSQRNKYVSNVNVGGETLELFHNTFSGSTVYGVVVQRLSRNQDRKVIDVMRPFPDLIPMTATIQAAATRMSEERSAWLPVGGPTGPVGVISAGDIVRRKAAQGESLSESSVSEIMTLGVVCCRSSDSVISALKLMQRHGIYQVGVMDEAGRLSAVVRVHDLLEWVLTPERARR